MMDKKGLSSLPVSVEVVVSWAGAGLSVIPIKHKQYAGWVDARDAAALVLARSTTSRRSAGVLSGLASALTVDDKHTVRAAMNFSQQDPFWVSGGVGMQGFRSCVGQQAGCKGEGGMGGGGALRRGCGVLEVGVGGGGVGVLGARAP
jgi:hypothetical protein